MGQRVTVEKDGAVLLIGVNRPEKRNVFDLETIEGFSAAYEQLADDAEVRVGVVFGHGDHFSAGLDRLRLMAQRGRPPGRGVKPIGALA